MKSNNNNRKYKTLETYATISSRLDTEKEGNNNDPKIIDYILNKNNSQVCYNLKNKNNISIALPVNSYFEKIIADNEKEKSIKEQILKNKLQLEYESNFPFNKKNEISNSNINILSNSIPNLNFYGLKVDNKSTSSSNSKRIIYSSKKNETINSGFEDLLNSNDFKISLSKMTSEILINNPKIEEEKFRLNSQRNNDIFTELNQPEESFLKEVKKKEENVDFKFNIINNNDETYKNNYLNNIDNINLNTIIITDSNSSKSNFPLKMNENSRKMKQIENDFDKQKISEKYYLPIDTSDRIIIGKNTENEASERYNTENQPTQLIKKIDNTINQIINTENCIQDTFIVHTTNSNNEFEYSQNNHKMKNSKFLVDNSSSNYYSSKANNKSRDFKRLREIKEEENLFYKLNEAKKDKINQKDYMKKRYQQNINKLKTNNLKEIYEILEKNIINIERLSDFGLSDLIVRQLIFPVIAIIQKRNLEFNFKNFESLAKELLNRIL